MMTPTQAVQYLRSKPECADLIRDAYMGQDVLADAERFAASDEFDAVMALIDGGLHDRVVMDIGAGAGAACYAFALNGAKAVYAVEPDLSDEVGARAIRKISGTLPIRVVAAVGEYLPCRAETVDVLYARQVLHHTRDLQSMLRECARVLRPGGLMIASREHVVDDSGQLQQFLSNHPIHMLAGGENAFPLDIYLASFRIARLDVRAKLGPYDSIINAFPEVRTQAELDQLPGVALRRLLGPIGGPASTLPGINTVARLWLRSRRRAGRLYSFVAVKRAD